MFSLFSIRKSILLLMITAVIMSLTPSFASLARPKAQDIPVKSLIIGTYIIDFKSVSPAHVETAQASAADTGQDQVYYRSDLTSGGLWINITSGSGVADILSSSEKVVSNADMDRLLLTHWIKNDGVVYEIGSGNAQFFSTLNPLADPLVYDAMRPMDTEREKQSKILENLDSDDDGYDTARAKKGLMEMVLKAQTADAFKKMDTAVDALDLATAKLRQDPKVSDAVIHAVDDVLTDLAIKRELFYLNALLTKLEDAGEKAGTMDFGTLSDQIWTAHGKLGEIVRALEAEIGTSEAVTPLDAVASEAADKLEQAALSGSLEAIVEAAEEKSVADQLSLGLSTQSPEAVAMLEDALKDAQNEAVVALLKGTSFAYEAAKANGEAIKTIDDMLTEETEAVQEKMENWQDVLDMLMDATSLQEDKTALLEAYNAVLVSTLAALPDTDMKPALQDMLTGTLEESQQAAAVFNVADNAVVQAGLTAKEQLESQLSIMNEAYADALENGDVEGAKEIEALSESLIAQLDGEEQAALDAYLDALDGVKSAEERVEALLSAEDGALQDKEGAAGDTGGESESGTGDDILSEPVTLTGAIALLSEARSEVEAIKGLISPEDLKLMDSFSELIDAVDVFLDEKNAAMALASLEALDALIPVLPDGFDGSDALGDLMEAMNLAKAQTAAIGDMESAIAFAEGQLMLNEMKTDMQNAVLDALEQADAQEQAQAGTRDDGQSTAGTDAGADTGPEADTPGDLESEASSGLDVGAESSTLSDKGLPITEDSVFDVLTGTLIIHVDSFVKNDMTYVGMKSLFDQIGGQAVWIPNESRALGIANGKTLSAIIGTAQADVNGQPLILDDVAELKDGRTYVPFNTMSAQIGLFLDARFDDIRLIIVPDIQED